MANIEDEEEQEEIVVVEVKPPKRKTIATLQVWGHCDWQFVSPTALMSTAIEHIESNVYVNVVCLCCSTEIFSFS